MKDIIVTCQNECDYKFEQDILFNAEPWPDLIESQIELFDVAVLHELSKRLREEFHCGHNADREMPEIYPEHWNTPLLRAYSERTVGYDLPCLISANRPAIDRVMLCAQDPLRSDGEAKLTVGTFFGIDSEYMRGRRHYGEMWRFIRKLVIDDCYDVWVTDAVKIFAGHGVIKKNPALWEICLSVLGKEIELFSPSRILAIGGEAGNALKSINPGLPIKHVKHPTAWGQRGTFRERFENYWLELHS